MKLLEAQIKALEAFKQEVYQACDAFQNGGCDPDRPFSPAMLVGQLGRLAENYFERLTSAPLQACSTYRVRVEPGRQLSFLFKPLSVRCITARDDKCGTDMYYITMHIVRYSDARAVYASLSEQGTVTDWAFYG